MASVLCPVCAQASFTSIEALRSSLIKVANGPLPCPLCGDLFFGLDKLTIHLFTHTTLLPSILSSNSVLNNNHQREHMESNSAISETVEQQVLSVCNICETLFHSEHLRETHMKVMHQCGKSLLEQEHQESEPLINTDSSLTLLSTRSLSDVTIYLYKCHLCDKMFKMKGSLRVHLKVVHSVGVKISSSQTEFYEKNKKSEIEIQKESVSMPQIEIIGKLLVNNNASDLFCNGETTKSWECDTCGKTFTTKYFLKKHKRLHTGILQRLEKNIYVFIH